MENQDNNPKEGLMQNKVDEEDNKDEEDNNSQEDEDEDQDDEDHDAGIKEDILRPASTRSKIVVNLKEPASADGKRVKRQFSDKDKIEYELDKYDKVRMQLYKSGEKLYKCYQETIKELETKPQYQPRKRKMPFYMSVPLRILQFIVLFFFIYCFFLIIQLALFNLVIVGIIFVFISKIWQFLEAFIDKFKFNYKTKDFVAFIE